VRCGEQQRQRCEAADANFESDGREEPIHYGFSSRLNVFLDSFPVRLPRERAHVFFLSIIAHLAGQFFVKHAEPR